jgi:hypothetical protein
MWRITPLLRGRRLVALFEGAVQPEAKDKWLLVGGLDVVARDSIPSAAE